jgi:hypothetical protein
MKPPPLRRPIHIIIRPLHEETGVHCHGRFAVYCEGKWLCISDNPVRDVGRGVPPDVVLIARHDFGLPDVVTTTIGAAAQGASREGENVLSFRDAAAARREARRRAAKFRGWL